jgi:hypothetical protein
MKPLGLALIALLLLPVTAASKEPNAPVRVHWNSTPEHVRAGGTWDARLSLLQGPGGFDPGKRRPVIVVTNETSGAMRQVPMSVDVPPNTFKAIVAFPRAANYAVAVKRVDPEDPERFADLGRLVRIEQAAPRAASSADAGGESWPWGLAAGGAIAALLVGAWSIKRGRLQAAGW